MRIGEGKKMANDLIVQSKSEIAVIIPEIPQGRSLIVDLRKMISEARSRVAVAVNSEAVVLYWSVGRRILVDVLKNKRAGYGEKIQKTISENLTKEFGPGWGLRKIQHCVRSADVFTKEQIVSAVRTQLGWTHLKMIMSERDALKRDFYLTLCAYEHWSTRDLERKMDGMLYERTAIARHPEAIVKKELAAVRKTGKLTPDIIFKSSYILDFLRLNGDYSERDLENAILSEIQEFLRELGTDFAFLDRQKRFTVDGIDYKIDLLFYHRSLKRLIAIDLKLGKFKPKYEGQMRLYLRWLDRNERRDGEESPIGLILCSEGNTEHVEYLMLEKSDVRVAQFLTELPKVEEVKARLQRAVALAGVRLAEHPQESYEKP